MCVLFVSVLLIVDVCVMVFFKIILLWQIMVRSLSLNALLTDLVIVIRYFLNIWVIFNINFLNLFSFTGVFRSFCSTAMLSTSGLRSLRRVRVTLICLACVPALSRGRLLWLCL